LGYSISTLTPCPSPKRRGETRNSLSQKARGDKKLPFPKGEGRQETPFPKRWGIYSLSLWERAGVRVLPKSNGRLDYESA